MKQFAEAFYGSDAWKQCRIAYKKSVGGLCEICRRNGLIKAGEIVHHKVHLNPVNINDPNVTLNWNNLELVCRDCHAAEHGNKKRYKIDAVGRVTSKLSLVRIVVATRKRKALSVSAPILRQIAKGGNHMARWQNQPNTEKREQVISLRMSGMTYKQIANAIGHKNESWIMTVCRENGLGGTSAWKDKRYAEMREYKAQGHTMAEVAERFGVSDVTATKVCKGISPQKCDYAEVSKKLKGRYIPLIHEQTAERLKTLLCDEFEWVGGYTCSTGYVTIRCKQCGAEFERSAQAIQKHQATKCPECRKRRTEANKEQRDKEREEKRKLKEQKKEQKKEQELKRKEQERIEKTVDRVCRVCGKTFKTWQNKKCCSTECSQKYQDNKRDYRIPMNKRISVGITAKSLYKRDNGTCWICGGKCDLNDYVTRNGAFIAGDWYPSVDHIVPIVDGGEHSWENVKLAHRICNSRRYYAEKSTLRS